MKKGAVGVESPSMSEALETQNPFHVFGLPAAYEIDIKALDKAYLRLQQVWHPDRFTNATASDKEIAHTTTARLNHCYQLLKNPLQRAEILLEITLPAKPMQPSSSVLMDQFSLQENIATLTIGAEIEAIREKITKQKEQEEKKLQHYLQEKNLLAWDSYFTLSFLQKTLDELKQKLQKL